MCAPCLMAQMSICVTPFDDSPRLAGLAAAPGVWGTPVLCLHPIAAGQARLFGLACMTSSATLQTTDHDAASADPMTICLPCRMHALLVHAGESPHHVGCMHKQVLSACLLLWTTLCSQSSFSDLAFCTLLASTFTCNAALLLAMLCRDSCDLGLSCLIGIEERCHARWSCAARALQHPNQKHSMQAQHAKHSMEAQHGSTVRHCHQHEA